jgi:hypothetical protein
MPTTPNFGLRYPSSSEDVEVWADIQALAEDVDGDLLTLSNLIGALNDATSYTPTLYNNQISGTPASISKTVQSAAYWRIGSGANSIIIAHAEVTASAAVANGAALTLPVASSTRWFNCGTAGIYGASPPAGQGGHAYMAASLDKIHFVTYTNSFLSASSGDTLRYLCVYPSAS